MPATGSSKKNSCRRSTRSDTFLSSDKGGNTAAPRFFTTITNGNPQTIPYTPVTMLPGSSLRDLPPASTGKIYPGWGRGRISISILLIFS